MEKECYNKSLLEELEYCKEVLKSYFVFNDDMYRVFKVFALIKAKKDPELLSKAKEAIKEIKDIVNTNVDLYYEQKLTIITWLNEESLDK